MKVMRILVTLLLYIVSPSLARELNILCVVDRFPALTKTPIINQVIGFIEHGHKVTLYAQTKSVEEKIHDSIVRYNLMDHVVYEIPEDLDQYDCIICQYGFLGNEFAQLRKKNNFKAKLITFFRGADITSTRQASRKNYAELFKQGDLFIPICRYFKYRLELLGCDQNKIVIVRSGIDCDLFSYTDPRLKPRRPLRIVTVGRLTKKKGIRFAIKAIADLLKKNNAIEYWIIGDGTAKKELQDLVADLKIEDKVTFLGWQTSTFIAEALRSSHIFLAPCVTVSGGNQDAPINTLKEAMATGLPVISTYHAGIPEVVEDGVSGYLVPEANVEDLVKKIELLIRDPRKWAIMGRAGRKKVLEEYDSKKINEYFIHILEELVFGESE